MLGWNELMQNVMFIRCNKNNNNNNNNNVTYTAQIRQSRKRAATCQRQTGMLSVMQLNSLSN